MTRAIGILITVVWLGCMVALFQRDIVPYWRAQDPPSQQIPDGAYQVAMTNGSGRRLGTTWITTFHTGTNVNVHSLTQLDLGAISAVLPVAGPLFVESDLSYDHSQHLEEFLFRLETALVTARVRGVRFGQQFACEARIGTVKQSMAIDADLSKYLGDSLRPFTHLQGLRIGQTWRLRLLDPIALLSRSSVEFTTRLVRVTARESIDHGGMAVECFRIETDGTVAWATDSGRVILQEVQVPLLGKWMLADEPYSDRARLEAKREVRQLRDSRNFGSSQTEKE
ncbi:MAG: hypothetical protein KF841_06755 [Phycisphaerae bacterium]|nr:hypothetical protein [Phycisphaerae bacterium]